MHWKHPTMNLLSVLWMLPCATDAFRPTARNPGGTRNLTHKTSPLLLCHISLVCTSLEDATGKINEQHNHYDCSPVKNGIVSDFSYTIDLPAYFVERNQNDILGGKLFAAIPEGRIVNGAVKYPVNSEITICPAPENFASRRRLTAVGTSRVLVLRISALDTTNTYSASQLYTYIFDGSQPYTQPTLSSQYGKLSFGKLNFVPAQNGVIDIQVSSNATGATSMAIRDEAITVVQSKYGVSSLTDLADHVMFCIPPGTGNWAGSSPVQSWRIVMNDQWCGFLSGFMHEMGHNLGLLHSNVGSQQYMDFTSYMSAGYATNYWPAKSFNGANNWQFGWFSDRQMTVDPSQGGKAVLLATFVDYDKSNTSNPVLIQVGVATYLQYNRAKDFNSGAQQCIDQVTVVQQLSNGTNLLGCIDPSSPQLIITNFDGNGRTLVLHACTSEFGSETDPDSMTLSVGYDQNYCAQATTSSQPTFAPVQPTFASVQPTVVPTALPNTFAPTAPPTNPQIGSTTFPSAFSTSASAATVSSPIKPLTASTSAPSAAPRKFNCSDTPVDVYVSGYGYQRCNWVAQWLPVRPRLCSGRFVRNACPLTCQLCTSNCTDNWVGIFVDSFNRNRTCKWLSLRSARSAAYCRNPNVAVLCPASCKVCT